VVTASVANFPPGPVHLRQCPQGFTSVLDCGPDTTIVADINGRGRGHVAIVDGPISATLTCDHTNGCVLAAFAGTADPRPPVATLELAGKGGAQASTRSAVRGPTTTAGSTTTTTTAPATCPLPDSFFRVAGSESTDQAMLHWATVVCQPNSLNLALDYTEHDGAMGRQQVIDGSVDLGVSELPFQADDLTHLHATGQTADDYLYVPLTASALGCMFNIQYVFNPATGNPFTMQHFRVGAVSTAGILNGTFDNLLSASIDLDNKANPDYLRSNGMPVLHNLSPIVRGDPTYATWLLTSWFYSGQAAQQQWENPVPVSDAFATGVTQAFPSNSRLVPTGTAYLTTLAVVQADPVPQQGLLGCVDTSIAAVTPPPPPPATGARPLATLQNPTGAWVDPTSDAVNRALALMTDNGDGTYTPVFGPEFNDAKAYPLPVVTYAIVPKNLDDTTRAETIKFLNWAITDGQRPGGLPNGYVPLPARVVAKAKEQIAKLTPTEDTTTTVPTPTTVAGGSGGNTSFGQGESAFGTGASTSGTGTQTATPSGSTTGGSSSGGTTSGSAKNAATPVSTAATTPVLALANPGKALPPLLFAIAGILLLVAGPVTRRLDARRRSAGVRSTP
jgi:ABC-type phosphate transport system substrate-binding protein